MNKIIYAVILLLSVSKVALAQSVDEIRSSGLYLWGEGKGKTIKIADNFALEALTSQLAVSITSSFQSQTEDKTTKDSTSFLQKVNTNIQSFSRATLTNTKRIVLSDEPDAFVLRYISNSEIDRIFAGRKNKIIDFTASAEKAERKGQVADALRYYY